MSKLDRNSFYILIAIVVFLLVYPVIDMGNYAFTHTGTATVSSFWCKEVQEYNSYASDGYIKKTVCSINITAKDYFLYALLLAITAFLIRVDVISVERILNYLKKLNADNESEEKPNEIDKNQ